MTQEIIKDLTQQKNDSDISQHRKSLKQLFDNLQNKEKQPTKYVMYDSVQRISYIKERILKKLNSSKDELSQKEQKKGLNIIEDARLFFLKFATRFQQTNIKEKIVSLGAVIYHSLNLQQYDWLQNRYSNYYQKQLIQIPTEYRKKFMKILKQFKTETQNDKVFETTRLLVLQCICKLESVYDSIKSHEKSIFQFTINRQKDYVLLMMISAYKAFSQDYNIYKRNKLKKLFRKLQGQWQAIKNTIEILRYLEGKDLMLGKLEPLTQMELSLQVVKAIDQYKQCSKISNISTQINLVKVSQTPKRRKVVNLLISGFLSQDVDKKQQWNQLLACMPDSQVYGLQWQSNTINQLVKFLAFSVKDMIMGKNVNELLTVDNPFVPAFEISIEAGQLLAYVVHKVFPYQFINIISYSLGSELIRAFLQKSIELNGGANINKVITMGGVSDIQEFQSTLQKTDHSINILNVRTKHDSVLKYLLKQSKPKIIPLGLHDVNQNIKHHWIQNKDVSSSIRGHFSFMTNFGTIAELLMLNEQ